MASGSSGISSTSSNGKESKALELTFVEEFCKNLQHIKQEAEMTDVTIRVGDLSIPCHKVVLAAASPYFRAMFTSGMTESQSGVVHFQGLDSEAVKLTLEYIYSVKCHIDLTNVEKIVQTSDLMQLKSLKDRCDAFMAKQIDENNCLSLWKFAKLYHMHQLAEKSVKQAKVSFMQLASGEEILSLTKEDLMALITCDDLVVTTEDCVLETTLRWVQHDLEARKDQLEEIVKHVRLSYCSKSFLTEVTKSNELVQQKIPNLEFLAPMLSAGSSKIEHSRISYWIPPELVLIGNYGYGITFYENGKFEHFTSIGHSPHKYSACAVPRGILVSGHGPHSNECSQYDSLTSSWKPIPNLLQGRCSHTSVYLDGKVYVIGGTTADERHRPYSYDPTNDQHHNSRPACGKYLRSIEICEMEEPTWKMLQYYQRQYPI